MTQVSIKAILFFEQLRMCMLSMEFIAQRTLLICMGSYNTRETDMVVEWVGDRCMLQIAIEPAEVCSLITHEC